LNERLLLRCLPLALALLSVPAAAQVCGVVRVEFNGCAAVSLPPQIDVTIHDDRGGSVVVSVLKQSDGAWEGSVRDSFRPAARTLSVDLPNVRTACNVKGSSELVASGASCRAVFSLQCEPLWSLHVINTQKKQKTPLSYRCETSANTLVPCASDDDPPPASATVALAPETPLTIAAVGWTQGVVLGLTATDGSAIEYAVRYTTLEKRGKQAKQVKLSDLAPRPAVKSAVTANPTLHELKAQQALAFEHIVLTWDQP
jgi:hypothetical protein